MRGPSLIVLFLSLSGCAEPGPTPAQPAAAPNADAAADPAASDAEDAKKTPLERIALPDTRSFEEELAALDLKIATFAQQHADAPQQWMPLASLAEVKLQRARLTGSYDTLAEVEALIAQAFERAPEGSGPIELRARFNYSLHRLDRVDADLGQALARPLLGDPERAALQALGANLKAQRGDLATAETELRAALVLADRFGTRCALAINLRDQGRWDEADALLAETAEMHHAPEREPLAWLHLHRGVFDLDQGRLDDALRHYQRAAQVMPGNWLVDEHIAEIFLLKGDLIGARSRYEDIVARTDGPEFMDALVEISEAEGKTEEAEAWRARARAVYEARLAQFPEAAYGHALDHYLTDPSQSQRALELAQANVGVRPNGAAHAGLALAQLGVGDADAARASLERAQATGWRSPDLEEVRTAVEAASQVQ